MGVVDFYRWDRAFFEGTPAHVTNFRDKQLVVYKVVYGYYVGGILDGRKFSTLSIGVPAELEQAKRITIAKAVNKFKLR